MTIRVPTKLEEDKFHGAPITSFVRTVAVAWYETPHHLAKLSTSELRDVARSVAVGDQSLKLSTVGGAKVKANVIASHAPNMEDQALNGNPVSGGEH